MMHRLMNLVWLSCLLAWIPIALAQESDPVERFNQAVDLAKSGKIEDAIGIWLDVLDEVEPEYRPKVHRALGLAYADTGRLPEAWHHLTA